MKRTSIFFSFSHKDVAWAERLTMYLKVAERRGVISLWDEERIQPGQKWKDEIREALNTTSIAILMVSPDYLASDFILDEEVPELLRRRQEEGLIVLPVIVRPCLWHTVDWLRQLQFWPKDARPLTSLSNNELDRELVDFVQFIVAVSERASSTAQLNFIEETITESLTKTVKEKVFFISYAHEDGDFAELLQLRIEKEGYKAWRDIEKLAVGVDWRQEIDQNIKESAAVIVILSPSSKESEYVTYEWAFAWGVGVPVIPIMLKPTPLHPRLETLQFLDFTNQGSRPWAKLITALGTAHFKKSH